MTLPCSHCKRYLPVERFEVDRSCTRGYKYICKPCRGTYRRKRYAEGYNVRARELQLVNRHGIDNAKFDELLAGQNGRCAICRTNTPGGKGWTVDHDHDACCDADHSCDNCRRAILCHMCNLGLGCFSDDVSLLFRAVDYLKYWSVK